MRATSSRVQRRQVKGAPVVFPRGQPPACPRGLVRASLWSLQGRVQERGELGVSGGMSESRGEREVEWTSTASQCASSTVQIAHSDRYICVDAVGSISRVGHGMIDAMQRSAWMSGVGIRSIRMMCPLTSTLSSWVGGLRIRPPPSASHASFQWGHVYFINPAVSDSHNYRPMLNSVSPSSPTCLPACHQRRVTELSRCDVSIHVSWQHKGRAYCSPQLQKRTPADISAGQAFSSSHFLLPHAIQEE